MCRRKAGARGEGPGAGEQHCIRGFSQTFARAQGCRIDVARLGPDTKLQVPLPSMRSLRSDDAGFRSLAALKTFRYRSALLC